MSYAKAASLGFFFLFVSVCYCQVPQTITLQMYLEEGGIPVDGEQNLTVSWYNVPVGGTPLHSETLLSQVTNGVATLSVGSALPITVQLLQQGPLWVGVAINQGAELYPRTPVASVPYALYAEHASVADRLAPDVTGVVTSINELAGAVELRSDSTIRVSRTQQTLTLSARVTLESGEIQGASGEHRFTHRPLTLLRPGMVVTSEVVANTFIQSKVESIDYLTNTITFITSAPLLDTESIQWRLHP